jgi:aryl-alcohol dehydrogenase-like predicted oxidoreductase
MTFGDENGHGVADETVSRKLFDAFLEAGGNFIDTKLVGLPLDI